MNSFRTQIRTLGFMVIIIFALIFLPKTTYASTETSIYECTLLFENNYYPISEYSSNNEILITYDGRSHKNIPIIISPSGKQLVEGTDFTYQYITETGETNTTIASAGEYLLFLDGIGNYSDNTNFFITICNHVFGSWTRHSDDYDKTACDGYREVRYCTKCSFLQQQNIAATNHQWSNWTTYYNNHFAGCTTTPEPDEDYCQPTSFQSRTCIVCYKEESGQTYPAIAHNFLSSVSNKGKISPPTCTKCEYSPYSDYEDDEQYFMHIVLSKDSYTYDKQVHKPKVKIYIVPWIDSYGTYYPSKDYDYKEYLCNSNLLSSSNYKVSYTTNCKKKGAHTVKITFKNNYSGTMTKQFKIVKNDLNKKSLDLYKGKSFKLKMGYSGDGKVKWKSSNPQVATVSSKGKVTAKNYGSCKIIATYKGKKYTCKVKIPHHKPETTMWITEYRTRHNTISVHIENNGKVNLTILSKDAKLIDYDYTSFDRNLCLANGASSIVIKPGKSKTVKFKVIGNTTWPGTDRKKIRIYMNYDGKTYKRYAN